MKKNLSTLFALLFSLILLSGCTLTQQHSLQVGQKALAAENYAEAVAAFEKAGSYEDAMMLKQYANAWLLLEGGEYDAAADAFRFLGDYKDSSLMPSYCEARKQEGLSQAAFSAGNTDEAVRAGAEAVSLYTGLSLFRDSDDRAEACRDLLYTNASDWMNAGRFDAASAAFAALGSFRDSADLQQYCRASLLMQQGSCLEAADVFSEIPGVLDSAAQADAARSGAYQEALALRDRGDYQAAADTFRDLGSYQDAQAQRDSTLVLLVRSLIASGSYTEALQKLNLLENPSSLFPAADAAESDSLSVFLQVFANAWLNAHAGVINGFFSRSLLQPYLEPGGELDSLLQAELPDDKVAENYGYVFEAAEPLEFLRLDEGFLAAKVHATASYYGANYSGNAMNETLMILIDTRSGNPRAAAVLPL